MLDRPKVGEIYKLKVGLDNAYTTVDVWLTDDDVQTKLPLILTPGMVLNSKIRKIVEDMVKIQLHCPTGEIIDLEVGVK